MQGCGTIIFSDEKVREAFLNESALNDLKSILYPSKFNPYVVFQYLTLGQENLLKSLVSKYGATFQ